MVTVVILTQSLAGTQQRIFPTTSTTCLRPNVTSTAAGQVDKVLTSCGGSKDIIEASRLSEPLQTSVTAGNRLSEMCPEEPSAGLRLNLTDRRGVSNHLD